MKALIFIALTSTAFAQSSADYALTTTVLDDGGGVQSSADYAQLVSLGGIRGIASDATPSVVRSGFTGQLYEATAILVSPVGLVLNEGTAVQLHATVTLDDATTLVPPTGDVAWSIQSGPLASVTASGMLVAGNVYADAPARARGSFAGLSSILNLNVRNIGLDDFGIYAADGISDLWQVGFFGESNADGRAGKDPDGDGQDNLFEFLSGYSPVDGGAFLRTRVLSWDGAHAQFEMSRVQPGTVYEIESSLDMADWGFAEKVTPIDLAEPLVLKLESSESSRFFRVHLSKNP